MDIMHFSEWPFWIKPFAIVLFLFWLVVMIGTLSELVVGIFRWIRED